MASNVVFVSGQGGLDPSTGKVVGPGLEEQTQQTIRNIELVLHSAGLELDDVVKTTVYLSDRALYQQFNEIYGRYFSKPYPSRAVVYCDLNYELLVEIEAIAMKQG